MTKPGYGVCITKHRLRSLFGNDFNLAVWQFFVRWPNLNNANIVLHVAIVATAFRQIRITQLIRQIFNLPIINLLI